MKKTLRNLMLGMMTLIAGSALTSCSNDDEPQAAQQEVKKGYVEFTLTRGADTRTTYTFNEETKGLDQVWKAGDQVVVNYSEGNIVEVFDMIEGAGEKAAKFAKKDSELAEGSSVVIYYLPGYKEEYDFDKYVVDLSSQTGTIDDLDKHVMFYYEGELKNGKISTGDYQTRQAIYHFTTDIDFGTGATVEGGTLSFFGGNSQIGPGANMDAVDPIATSVQLSEGHLTSDLYIAVVAGMHPKSLVIDDNHQFKLNLPEFVVPGNIYTFTQKDLIKESAITEPAVGLVIGADGKFYANKASAKAAGTTAEAMIAHLSTDRGLAIALEDASSDGMIWTDATQAVSDWAEKHQVKNLTSPFWNLPTAYDFQNMFIGCGSSSTYVEPLTDDNIGMEFDCSGFKTMLQNAGGNVLADYYWTSTDKGDSSWFYNVKASTFRQDVKSYTTNHARFVLAFQF